MALCWGAGTAQPTVSIDAAFHAPRVLTYPDPAVYQLAPRDLGAKIPKGALLAYCPCSPFCTTCINPPPPCCILTLLPRQGPLLLFTRNTHPVLATLRRIPNFACLPRLPVVWYTCRTSYLSVLRFVPIWSMHAIGKFALKPPILPWLGVDSVDLYKKGMRPIGIDPPCTPRRAI